MIDETQQLVVRVRAERVWSWIDYGCPRFENLGYRTQEAKSLRKPES